jgi:predicted RNase H-related nuclease YkuK (DUF458 family)
MKRVFKRIDGEKVEEITYILDILKNNPGSQVYVGTDSQKKRKTVEFAAVIAIRYGRRGCHVIYNKWSIPKKRYGKGLSSIERRLREEIEVTMEVAQKLQDHSIKVYQIDFDINEDDSHISNTFVDMAVGWAIGLGYNVAIKPHEQVATKAANQIVNQ